MKLLLRSLSFTKQKLLIICLTVTAFFGLTIANHMEMLTLGVLVDTGADFFALFSPVDKKGFHQNYVLRQDIEKKWSEIDRNESGVITKNDAAVYVANKKELNPIQKVIFKIKNQLSFKNNLKLMLFLLLSVALFKAFFLFFSRYMSQMLSIKVSRDLRQNYFDHIQKLSMNFYQKFNIGTLSSRVVGDSSQMAQSTNSLITNYLQAPFTIISTLGICFYLSWQLSMVIFFGLPLIIFPVIFVTRKVKKTTHQLHKKQENFASILIDFLSGIQTVKVFAMETFSIKKYQEQNHHMARLEKKTAKYDLLTRPILHLITTFCLAFVMIVGLHILKVKLSELIVFVGLLYNFYEPVKKFAEENTNIQKGVVAAERMFEVLHMKPLIYDTPFAKKFKAFKSRIEFDNVWFRYENQWVLKGLSFSVKKGETVALVGATGAGKSTIVQLLPRLYDVQKGEIRIDGEPLKNFTQKSLREHISFVLQKPFLFYDTIAANIAYGRGFSQEEIINASKKAYAHEFIKELPDLYETMLAETGKNFSGGQQQRLAIARALVKKAPILVLDEATSSLDSISENKIKMAIKGLHGEVTQILIAHRLSTIEYADRIIYIEDGQKVSEGSKEELMKNCKPFKTMWATHFNLKEKSVL